MIDVETGEVIEFINKDIEKSQAKNMRTGWLSADRASIRTLCA